ncbi:MAG: hypothetical protein HOH43_16025, partial [Candidatus Latescibacteria bacterium]|nr:hypothetical protein [Candidatus Latescibacterota bacterium]
MRSLKSRKCPALLLAGIFCIGCLTVERSNPIDSDPGVFAAKRPSLLLPLGREQWYAGTRHLVSWLPGDRDQTPVISLQLSLDDGQTFNHTIAEDISNSGNLDWLVPDLPSKMCRIRVAFADSGITGPGKFAILRKPVPVQRTLNGGEWPSWRNERLAFMSDRAGDYDIYVRSGSTLIRVTSNNSFDGYPSFDSKGFHLAFTSNRTGRNEIWATEQFFTRNSLGPVQLTHGGGTYPAWRQQPRARRLVFISTSPGFNGNPVQNLSTVIFTNDLDASLNITDVRLRADSGSKERPIWVEPSGQQFIYYKQPGSSPNTIRRIRIDDVSEDLPPEAIVLPFGPETNVRNLTISASSSRAAMNINGDIWVLTMRDGEIINDPLQITFHAADDDVPDWRGDTQLAFQSNRTGRWEIWTVEMP